MKDINEALKREQLDVLFTNNQHGWVGSLILWLGILFAYGFPNLIAAYLLTCGMLIAVIMHVMTYKYYISHVDNITYSTEYWINRTIFVSATQGILLGVTPWFMLDLNNPSMVYLITALLVLPMFGSAVVSGTSKKIHLIWSVSSTLPLVLLLLLSEQREYQIMAAMLLIAGIPSSVLMNIYFYNLFSKTILLKYENEDLLIEVQQQKAIAVKESKEKSRFIAATSHDLRQPLYALNLYLEVLAEKLTQTEQTELLKKAMLSSHSLNDLLNSLMDVARLDSGSVQAVYQNHEVKSIIGTVLQDILPLAKRRDIQLSTQGADSKLIYTDAVLLCRILRNLTLNAVRHNTHCQVDILVSLVDDCYQIEVRDNGKGIAKDEQETIFSEFYQIDNQQRDRNKGMGLGLPIVNRLCQLLNIKLKLKSKLGVGTSFYLTLKKEDKITEWVDDVTDEQQVDPSGLFIVLVDDDEVICDAIRALLRNWDCEVLVALSEEDLFAELKSTDYHCPDVIISDYRLAQNSTGIDLIKSLRSYFKKDIEAIIISGEASKMADISHCEWMQKPVSADVLKKKLALIQDQGSSNPH